MLHDPVDAPALEPALHNLLDAGNIVDPADDDWKNGIKFTPRGCYKVSGLCAVCEDVDYETEGTGFSDPQECIPHATFNPYLLDLGIVFPTPDRYDIKSVANEDMELGTSARLERMIWAGCEGDSDTPTLADGASLGAALSPQAALGAMLAEFANADSDHVGAKGTVHVSPRIAVHLLELLVMKDDVLYTRFGGHRVVIGNYPATHIAGHLGKIDVYLGEIYVLDAPDAIPASNELNLQIQRLALAAWNPCAAWVQEVTLAESIDGGSP